MTPPAPSRGDVWLADLPDDKRRPVLVLTRDPMGRMLNAVICAPITTRVRDISTEVPIGPEAGLRRQSVVSIDNTTLVRRTFLIHRMGRASADTMSAACEALAIAVGCD